MTRRRHNAHSMLRHSYIPRPSATISLPCRQHPLTCTLPVNSTAWLCLRRKKPSESHLPRRHRFLRSLCSAPNGRVEKLEEVVSTARCCCTSFDIPRKPPSRKCSFLYRPLPTLPAGFWTSCTDPVGLPLDLDSLAWTPPRDAQLASLGALL